MPGKPQPPSVLPSQQGAPILLPQVDAHLAHECLHPGAQVQAQHLCLLQHQRHLGRQEHSHAVVRAAWRQFWAALRRCIRGPITSPSCAVAVVGAGARGGGGAGGLAAATAPASGLGSGGYRSGRAPLLGNAVPDQKHCHKCLASAVTSELATRKWSPSVRQRK